LRKKRQFFRRKLAKIAENCDHNIDPWNDGLYLALRFSIFCKLFLCLGFALEACGGELNNFSSFSKCLLLPKKKPPECHDQKAIEPMHAYIHIHVGSRSGKVME
jgi:hypothetical protein